MREVFVLVFGFNGVVSCSLLFSDCGGLSG